MAFADADAPTLCPVRRGHFGLADYLALYPLGVLVDTTEANPRLLAEFGPCRVLALQASTVAGTYNNDPDEQMSLAKAMNTLAEVWHEIPDARTAVLYLADPFAPTETPLPAGVH